MNTPAAAAACPAARERERGASLVEVLVAMLLLLFVMLGVLPLLVMALQVERVAEAQSEMSRKAQAVVEIVRVVRSTGNGGSSGILPLAAGTRNLPYTAADTGFDFWGPAGVGVVEATARYRLTYEVQDAGNDWLITVFAEPALGGRRYLDAVVGKGVRYASRIPK